MTDFEVIRNSWLNDLLLAGRLTSHTQSLPGDERFAVLTVPAFGLLEEMAAKYKNLAPSDQKAPQWFKRAFEVMEEEGGSPRNMQLQLMRILNDAKPQ